jgi:hypothetical protein
MTGRRDRLSKHPDGGKKMIEALKKLGFWSKLKKARSRVTKSGHNVGRSTSEEDI